MTGGFISICLGIATDLEGWKFQIQDLLLCEVILSVKLSKASTLMDRIVQQMQPVAL